MISIHQLAHITEDKEFVCDISDLQITDLPCGKGGVRVRVDDAMRSILFNHVETEYDDDNDVVAYKLLIDNRSAAEFPQYADYALYLLND